MICDFDVSVFLSTRTLRPLATSSRSECPSFRSEARTPTQTALPSEHELLFLGMRAESIWMVVGEEAYQVHVDWSRGWFSIRDQEAATAVAQSSRKISPGVGSARAQ